MPVGDAPRVPDPAMAAPIRAEPRWAAAATTAKASPPATVAHRRARSPERTQAAATAAAKIAASGRTATPTTAPTQPSAIGQGRGPSSMTINADHTSSATAATEAAWAHSCRLSNGNGDRATRIPASVAAAGTRAARARRPVRPMATAAHNSSRTRCPPMPATESAPASVTIQRGRRT